MVQKAHMHKELEEARKELLDLSLRNPLLNYRLLKSRGLEIVNKSPSEIYKVIVSDKKEMNFAEAEETENSEGLSLPLQTEEEGPSIETEEDHQKNLETTLQTNYTDKQLENRLLNTYYYARTHIEEKGVNILYIAMGMLQWYEAESSQEIRRAPLILIPVQLDRVSAREQFTISYTEDDIVHNLSLQEKMKIDFGIAIPEFPEDGELNVDEYLRAVTESIAGQKRWLVDTESIVIGFFASGKFLMYRDLDMTLWPDHLQPENHSIMSALLGDGFKEDPSHIDETDHIDKHFHLTEANHVMDADSSQIKAILDANQGRNMVIQGPPGTGKSQTITNIIAEAIGSGKKVLFVSEKMAALDVVKRRLDDVGLGVACLELHSDKANRKSLLVELSKTLELGRPKDSGSNDVVALEELRTRLNDYCEAVHTEICETEISPFQALGQLTLYHSKDKGMTFPTVSIDSVETWTAEEYRRKEALIEEFQEVITSLGPPAQHPFWGSKKKVVMPTDLDELKRLLQRAAKQTQQLETMSHEYAIEINSPPITAPTEAIQMIQMLGHVIAAPPVESVYLQSEKWLKEEKAIRELIDMGMKYTTIHKKYDSLLLPEAWNQDVLQTRQRIVQYQDKWWKFLSGDYRKAKNKILGLCRNPKDRSLPVLNIIDAIIENQHLQKSIENQQALAERLFTSSWKTVDSDWEQLNDVVQWLTPLKKEIERGEITEWIFDFLNGNWDKTRLAHIRAKLEGLVDNLSHTMSDLEELLDFNSALVFEHQQQLIEQKFSSLLHLFSGWLDNATELDKMAHYNRMVVRIEEKQLQPYIDLCETGELAGEQLLDAFRWNWYRGILSKAFNERPSLAHFERTSHEHVVDKFQDLDRRLAAYNRIHLLKKHWEMLPRHEAGGQLGVLRREFEKRSRHLPIRQLMTRAGKAVQAIKPVFMMSPMSIATYLPPTSVAFDLVIFDEASQVKPADAFGALIRSKQAIVVGDSKQLPPTDFFDVIADEENQADDYFVSDMESILGLFLGQNAPQSMLRWHYRSRHESLITVSNHEFYDNRLVIFPSPVTDQERLGLVYHQLPDTYYDRGGSRANKLEAKEVARAVLEHVTTDPHLTLGVAAFSVAQMQAVMDEVELLRRENPATESFFSDHPHEPFFVKNLENVQGDERDVIFISTGYGKTKEGYLSMGFGPLNREGGERRLNVLITRARRRCEVFTNLCSDDIDLNRSESRGVKAFKTFLKYAETGHMDIPSETGRGFDSPFEEAVYKALSDLGYDVQSQIGSGGFYIDLAIKDESDRFILGIECDGSTYHSARSARDRDRLRQEVLEGLGWTIHRIWSTDWFRHQERELERVVETIEKAKIKKRTEDASNHRSTTHAKSEIIREASTAEKNNLDDVVKYQVADPDLDLGGREFHTLPMSRVADWVCEVVKIESPVHVREVMKRVCEAINISRIGSRIKRIFEEAFHAHAQFERRGDFLWLKEMKVPPIRDRSELESNRQAQFISDEEFEEVILLVVRRSFGIQTEQAVQLAYRTLGFPRTTEGMKTHLHAIINAMVEKNKVIRDDDELTVDDQ